VDARIEGLLREYIDGAEDKLAAIEGIRQLLFAISPQRSQPVDFVRWLPVEQVEPNDYNPNNVAHIELGLLLQSIWHDGYTQPIVVSPNGQQGKYTIVDGFHRYFVLKRNQEIYRRCHGRLPCVILDKGLNDRMAATIRHNRARGKHTVAGMSNLVFKMLDGGMSDADICNELGMEPEELLRLKHITGFSKLFADVEYNKAWVARMQINVKLRQQGAGE